MAKLSGTVPQQALAERAPHTQRARRIPAMAAGVMLIAVVVTLMSATAARAGGVTVTDLSNGATAPGLAETLVGGGLSISNVKVTGSPRAAGSFTGGAGSIGFESGIVLSSGKVQSNPEDEPCSRGVEGPNTCYEETGEVPAGPSGSDNITSFEAPGDEQLSSLAEFPTFDASILEFDFVPTHGSAQFSYVFSSEEYSNYANTPYNDVFAFYVNGNNCALVPGTAEPVAVNRINNGNDWGGDATPHHPELFRDNVRPAPSIESQMDGLTTMLTCTASVTPGQSNHMKLAIADASDPILDSAVFIGGQSLVSGTQISTVLTGGGHSGEKASVPLGTQVSDHAILSGPTAPGATGTVTYRVYSDSECTTLVSSSGTVAVAGGTAPPSQPQSLALGTYYWQASYSGDANNNASTGQCGAEVLTVHAKEAGEEEPGEEEDPTSVLTSLSGGGQSGAAITVSEGTPVGDLATLRGHNAPEAGGSVIYAVYSDGACTNLVAAAGTVNVTSGVVASSSALVLASGTYYWQASYSGDAGNAPGKSACGEEVLTVTTGSATGCSRLTGAAGFGSGATEQRITDSLSTNLADAGQQLGFSWAGGAQHLVLTRLTKAKCTVSKNARKFTGQGEATINGTSTYFVSFTLSKSSKGVVGLTIKITKKKPTATIASFKDKVLEDSSEVIS